MRTELFDVAAVVDELAVAVTTVLIIAIPLARSSAVVTILVIGS